MENSKLVKQSAGTSQFSTEVSKDPKSVEPKEEFNKGVIFYLRGGSIVGVLMWNISGKIYRARQVQIHTAF